MLPIHFSHFLFGQCQRRVTWKGTAIMQNLLELCFAPGSILFQQVFAWICELSVSPKIWLISVFSWSVCKFILARRDLFKAMPLGLFHIQVKSNVVTVLFLRQGKISQWEFQNLQKLTFITYEKILLNLKSISLCLQERWKTAILFLKIYLVIFFHLIEKL